MQIICEDFANIFAEFPKKDHESERERGKKQAADDIRLKQKKNAAQRRGAGDETRHLNAKHGTKKGRKGQR